MMIQSSPIGNGGPVLSRRKFTGLAAMAGVGLVMVSACSTPAANAPSSGANGTLRMGVSYPPTPNLDPGNSGSAYFYLALSYEPLIRQGADGSPQPALATSWNYVGDGNKSFEIHLRDGVKFSDGTPLTADVVKK